MNEKHDKIFLNNGKSIVQLITFVMEEIANEEDFYFGVLG